MSIKAAVMTAPQQPLELWDIDDPVVEPGGVLLETVASEVCGTDVHLHHGRLSSVPYPIVPGHISVGRVSESNGVERDVLGERLDTGDVVTFYDVHETCHSCYYCLVAGQPNRCPRRRVYGITYSAREGPLGGWAERIYLKPGVKILKLPESLSADDVIGGGCGLFTGFAAVERGDLAMGDTVLVQGTGPVGLAAIAFSALRGAGQVIAIGDPSPRLKLAAALGADMALSLSETTAEGREATVRDATGGRGVDVALECAGVPEAVPEGFRLLRDGGTYVIAGHYTDTGSTTINPHLDINRKHADVRGRWGLDFGHVYRALGLLARHRERLPFASVIGRRYALDQANQALADVEGLEVTKAIITP
ncbi:MAG: zinc-binding dehydrogenase [Gemmatimonadetes bacterium]|uniref:Zinc-binding dehydrogenase n=1 Tax=Candidatus Kutchimonas denitrificans TaxID=3056748 RepID=A0AAE4Z614_9BACT|nr:zinc-binding dehydrogenase [Gemmatimonadota bacterium]NIR74228.1 zinc-binding dehydrogenase [Candidatus Kutchimonas denitrificans]NIR99850.1 zinc-binding dehydrogenase [Gemmatimonadota bacterium]NIT65439.1 zinc-binding dehydrogenase [Gemmatimonadota bacterium]NIU51804.1 zinc-binding dehydrogenase [Gemmatimonadota bacterium]